MRRGGAKSFVDDLVLGRGVVLSRAATSLRSIETQPWTRRFVCFLDRQIIPGSSSSSLLLLRFLFLPSFLPSFAGGSATLLLLLLLFLLRLLRLKGETFSVATVQLRLKGTTFIQKRAAGGLSEGRSRPGGEKN